MRTTKNWYKDTLDPEYAIHIPERLVTAVLMISLDFQYLLGDKFASDVDNEDHRILFCHRALIRGVQIRWHEGDVVVFLGEREPNAPYDDPDFFNAIERVREFCINKGVKIEADYDYPFGEFGELVRQTGWGRRATA
jgi:hypothetical protein